MNRYCIIFSLPIILGLASATPTFAHPGRTDSYGCHTCRTNCPNWGLSYGDYHCHNAKALPQPEEPIHSRYGGGGTGYTVPAPEYKNPTNNIPSITLNNKNTTPHKKEVTTEDIVVGGSIVGGLGWLLKKLISSLK